MTTDSLISRIVADFHAYLPRLAYATAAIVVGLLIAVAVNQLVLRALRRRAAEVRVFVGRLAFISVLMIVVISVLSILKIHIAAVAAITGALGLAVSLSLQDVAKNLIAGLYLLMEHPFHVGDTITVQGVTGRVKLIDMRTTTLQANDNQEIIIPNTIVMSSIVEMKAD